MTRLKAFFSKLREDRGNLSIALGVTLLTIVIATTLTMNTASAASLMKSGETSASIRAAIEDTTNLALERLIKGHSSAIGVRSESADARAFVKSETHNVASGSITVTIIGESMKDNVLAVTTTETFTKVQANYFAGYDRQGVPFWIATNTPGTGTAPSPHYTGYQRGSK